MTRQHNKSNVPHNKIFTFPQFFPLWNDFDPYTYRGKNNEEIDEGGNTTDAETQQTQVYLIPDKARRREDTLAARGR